MRLADRIGEAVRAERLRRGLSQAKLAALADLNHQTVGRVERGDDVRTWTAEACLVALGLRVTVGRS